VPPAAASPCTPALRSRASGARRCARDCSARSDGSASRETAPARSSRPAVAAATPSCTACRRAAAPQFIGAGPSRAGRRALPPTTGLPGPATAPAAGARSTPRDRRRRWIGARSSGWGASSGCRRRSRKHRAVSQVEPQRIDRSQHTARRRAGPWPACHGAGDRCRAACDHKRGSPGDVVDPQARTSAGVDGVLPAFGLAAHWRAGRQPGSTGSMPGKPNAGSLPGAAFQQVVGTPRARRLRHGCTLN
jgi:hypothetical protein